MGRPDRGPFAMNAATIFATIARAKHVAVEVFNNEATARSWLRKAI